MEEKEQKSTKLLNSPFWILVFALALFIGKLPDLISIFAILFVLLFLSLFWEAILYLALSGLLFYSLVYYGNSWQTYLAVAASLVWYSIDTYRDIKFERRKSKSTSTESP